MNSSSRAVGRGLVMVGVVIGVVTVAAWVVGQMMLGSVLRTGAPASALSSFEKWSIDLSNIIRFYWFIPVLPAAAAITSGALVLLVTRNDGRTKQVP